MTNDFFNDAGRHASVVFSRFRKGRVDRLIKSLVFFRQGKDRSETSEIGSKFPG